MSKGYIPNYEMNLMNINVLALTSEADCLIVLEELRVATLQIDKDIERGIKTSEWEESAKICRDNFDHKVRLVTLKLGEIRERAAIKAKKEEEFARRHQSNGGYSAEVISALTFRKVAKTVLPEAEYNRVNNLAEHFASLERFKNNVENEGK